MSNKSRKKRKVSKSKNPRVSETNHSFGRRIFLIGSAAALASITKGGHNSEYENGWSFLKNPTGDSSKHVSTPVEEVVGNYVPMGPKFNISPGTRELNELREDLGDRLTATVKAHGLKPGEFTVNAVRKQYAVPASQKHTAEVIEYCSKATELLYSKIKGLVKLDVHWKGVEKGDDYSEDFDKKVLVGQSQYEVQQVEIYNKADPSRRVYLSRATRDLGASGEFIISQDNHSVKEWYAFISANPNAITAPISELGPLSTAVKCFDHTMNVGVDDSNLVHEALWEGIRGEIGMDFVREFNIPRGEYLVKKAQAELSRYPDYQLVPQATQWIKKNGMQAAFDLYMDNPAKFKQAICGDSSQ